MTPARLTRMNQTLVEAGAQITIVTGTMWVAILFAILACVSLPAVLLTGNIVVIVSWVTQSFLQLVLLPIIIVGQTVQGAKTEARDLETHDAVMVLLGAVHGAVVPK